MNGKLRFLCCAMVAALLTTLMLGRGDSTSLGAQRPGRARIAHANASEMRHSLALSARRRERLRSKRHRRLVRRSRIIFRRLAAEDAYDAAVSSFPDVFTAHVEEAPINADRGDQALHTVSAHSAIVTRPDGFGKPAASGQPPHIPDATRADRRRAHWQSKLASDPSLSRSVVASTFPLEATDADGQRSPLSTTLEQDGDAVRPRNALVREDIRLDAAEGVSLPDVGIGLRMADSPRRTGELHGDRVFWPNVARDTDYLVASTPNGLETFHLLRSADSPETIPYDLSLPDGAAIVLDPLTGRADIESKDGDGLAQISPPFAADADGRPVEAHWVLEDGRLRIEIRHRLRDLRYPILVDPSVIVDQLYWKDDASVDFGGWEIAQSSPGFWYWQTGGPYGRGLQQEIPGGYTPQQYQWSMWRFRAPRDTFISQFIADELSFGHFGGRSCLTLGFWNGYGWDPGVMQVSSYTDSSPWTRCSDGANIDNSLQNHTVNAGTATHGNYAAVQLWASSATYSSSPELTELGGAWTRVEDDAAPSGPTFGGVPAGWSNAGQLTVSGSANDGGLGMGEVVLSYSPQGNENFYGLADNDNMCWPDPQHGNLCPTTLSASAAQTFPEGYNTLAIDAADALGNQMGDVAGSDVPVRIDRTPPTMTLEGPAYELAGQDVGESSYGLTVHAADDNANPAVTPSGLASVDLLVDGQVKDPWSQGCDAVCLESGADEDKDVALAFRPDDYADGSHTVAVRVRDQAGNVTTSPSWTLNVVSGSVTYPGRGLRAAKRLTLQAHARRPGITSVQWQYRAAGASTWTAVPLAGLSDKQYHGLSSSSIALSNGDSQAVSWDLTAAGGPSAQTTAIDVRGVFSGGAAGATPATRVQIDLKGLDTRTGTTDIGPGSVNLLTGNLALNASDVSIDTGVATLSVSRTYNSRDGGTSGPLGPGWSLGTPGLLDDSEYTGLSEGAASVSVVEGDGTTVTFSMTAAGYQPEPGFESLSLTKEYFAASGGTDRRYVLKDITDGSSVEFRHTSLSATSFYPAVLKSTASAGTSTAVFEAGPSGKPRVKEIYAPSGSQDCTASFVKGCRSLRFVYAGSTTATGGLPSQWGDVKDQLSHVDFHAWDAATGAVTFEPVSNYQYDNTGRLRAQWDPRVSPALKTIATYDSAGLLWQVQPPGEQSWTFSYASQSSDTSPGRLASASRSLPSGGSAQWTVAYGAALSGSTAPLAMTATDVAAWGQTDVPFDATAIFPPDAVPTLPTSDYSRAEVHYLNRDGYEVNTLEPGGGLETSERDGYGNVVRELGAQNRKTALDAGSSSATQAAQLDTRRTYGANGQELLDEVRPLHQVRLDSGELVDARRHTHYAYDEGSTTGTHHLQTTMTVGAQISGRADADIRTTKTEWNWSLLRPTAVVRDPSNWNNRTETVYDAATGHVLKQRLPASAGKDDAGTTLAVDYTAGANSVDAACGNRPEWQGLLCRTEKAAPVANSTLPAPIVSTITYNDLGLPTTETDTSGSTSRTKTTSYDAAGRVTNVATSSNAGAQVPNTHIDYDPATGRVVQRSSTGGSTDTAIAYEYDSLGRLTKYTDGDGATAQTTYDLLDRPTNKSDGSGGQQDLTYDPVTGQLTRVDDSQAGAFTAQYDLDGRLTSQQYAGTVAATYQYAADGTAVDVDYEKTGCSQACTWLHDSVTPSIHGQWRTETTASATKTYFYDNLGRLSKVEDTPLNENCVVRQYGYDQNSNRTYSKTTPTTGACTAQTTSAATIVNHKYDALSRLTDAGVTYDDLGRTTALPPADSGAGRLTTAYFGNDLVFSQTQQGRTNQYILDAALRPYKRTTTSSSDSTSETSHYADDSDQPSWTSTSDGHRTRNVEGIDGDLVATVDDQAGPVLQLADLHGDVAATAATSSTHVQPLQVLTVKRTGSSWSAQSARQLPRGHYVATAAQSDRSGNTGASPPVHFEVTGSGKGSGAYEKAVLDDKPKAYWRLGESSGTTAVDQTGVATGTYRGAALGTAGALPADTDTAATFNGTADVLVNSSPWRDGELTAEAWIKTSQPVNAPFLSQGDDASGVAWSAAVTNDAGHYGQIRARVRLGDTPFTAYSTQVVSDGRWHYVGVSFDRHHKLTLVVDGVTQSSVPSRVNGPVLALGFEEATGSSTIVDQSGGDHDGTLSNGVRGGGEFGRGIQFSSYATASIPNQAELRVSSAFTVEGWVKLPSAVGSSVLTDVLTEYGTSGTVFSLQAYAGFNRMMVGVGTNTAMIQAAGLRTGVWAHVAMSFANGTRKVYVNGALVRTDTGITAPAPSTTAPLRIGGGDTTLDEIRLYPRELSQAEITTDMTKPVEASVTHHPVLALGFDTFSFGKDSSEKNHSLTWSLTSTSGKFDTGAAVTASAYGRATGDGDLAAAGPMTVEGWLKTSSTTPLVGGTGLAMYGAGPSGQGPGVCSGSTCVWSTMPPATNVWAHVAMTFDGSVMRVYVNGSLVGSTPLTAPSFLSDDKLYVGALPGQTWGAGVVDEVRVYRRALAQTEIARDMGTSIASYVGGVADPAMHIGRQQTGVGYSGAVDEAAVWTSALPATDLAEHYRLGRVTDAAPSPTVTDPSGAAADATPSFAGAASSREAVSDALQLDVFSGSDTSQPPVQSLEAPRTAANWGVEGAQGLPPGDYTAQVTQTDASGRYGTAKRAFTVGAATDPETSYRTSVLADAPTAYWRLADTTGSAASDDSGNGHEATFQNGVLLGQTSPLTSDTSDHAVTLDGVDDRVDAGDAGDAFDYGTHDFSVEAWIKTSVAGDEVVASKGSSWALAVTSDTGHVGQARFTLNDGTSSVVAYSNVVVYNNAWHHVVVSVRRGTDITIYVDGSPGTAVADTTSAALGSAASLLVGAGPTGTAFKGSIDEVALYSTALTSGRVSSHWRLGAQLDHTAPAVTMSAPADGSSVVDSTPTFSGTAGSGSADASTLKLTIIPDASTGPLETFDSDEFGVPEDPSYPHRYSWLGGKERSTELPSGVVQMGVRSYVPALGRFLQSDPIMGGSANAYDYAYQDPLNVTDLSGEKPDSAKDCVYKFIGGVWICVALTGQGDGPENWPGPSGIPVDGGKPVPEHVDRKKKPKKKKKKQKKHHHCSHEYSCEA